jgi:hypothetical protein
MAKEVVMAAPALPTSTVVCRHLLTSHLPIAGLDHALEEVGRARE